MVEYGVSDVMPTWGNGCDSVDRTLAYEPENWKLVGSNPTSC